MDWIRHFALILLIKVVTPATIPATSVTTSSVNTTSVTSSVLTASVPPKNFTTTNITPSKNEESKTNRTYQVTENIKDIPDDRTLPPIVPNFGLVIPLNFGNNTIVNNNKENSIDREKNNTDAKNEFNVKKHSFSILHIKAEYDDKPAQQHQNVFSKVFGGLKDYVYNLKRGVVDGLHSFFHHQDDNVKPVKETEFHGFPNFHHKFHSNHDKFHRNIDGDEHFDYDEHHYYDDDDESKERYSH